MVYLYAVTDPLGEPPAGTGLEEAPLRVVASGELTAVVSDRDEAPLIASEENLWAHEHVVEALMAQRPALPMRFGSVLADDLAVAEMLASRCEELAGALRRVSGAVELSVRVAWEPSEAAAGDAAAPSGAGHGPGAAYLLGLSSTRRRASALAERLDRSLAGLSRTRVRRLLASPTLPVSAAYLVDRERVEAFRGRIATLDAQLPDAEIVCTGPWPPYSFTEGEGA